MAEASPAATTYREQAARLRELAHESACALLRFELLEVAAQFETLAEFAEQTEGRAPLDAR